MSAALGGTFSADETRIFNRYFTKDTRCLTDFGIKFIARTAHIERLNGEVVFHQENVIVPEFWSQTAVNILAQKYFRRVGVPSHVEVVEEDHLPTKFCRCVPLEFAMFTGENDFRQVAHRLAGHWVYTGLKNDYFKTISETEAFYDEIKYMLYMQIAAPNSPQFFNTGLYWAYGITGNDNDHYAGDAHAAFVGDGEITKLNNSYEAPQIHACFINGVEDKLVGPNGIMDLWTKEARIFKYGSGSGCNYSKIRGRNEPLSGGGYSSGLLSFLKIGDAVGGAIKSGGTTRRASRMVILNDDHPDLLEFINWKVHEEDKAAALIAGSTVLNQQDEAFPIFDASFEGEAYTTISGQNANNSINASKAFMFAARAEAPFDKWLLWPRTNGTSHMVMAKEVLRKIAEAAWKCGDPGLFFGDTINYWNTCREDDKISASNPCQPGDALLLTPEGLKKLADLSEGAIIWSADGWVSITKKWATGTKAVYKYRTTSGEFYGTKNHNILQQNVRIHVDDARTIDVLAGDISINLNPDLNKQAVMDGLFLGDGSTRVMNHGANAYDVLCIGTKDQDYFDYFEEDSELWPQEFDNKQYRINTTLANLGRTWSRAIPDKYKYGALNDIAAFLKGLFSANGCVQSKYNRVSLKTTSPALRDDVQLLLSVLGIRSYYTTNKPTKIQHSNGEYESKQSYDINIGRLACLERFYAAIGFIQIYKMNALENILNSDGQPSFKRMSSIIKDVTFIGVMEVFDITVSGPSHTYWTNGCNVSNCSEYLWFEDTACNLASLNLLSFYENETFNIEAFIQAVTLWITVLDISISMAGYPSAVVARKSLEYRTLGLGYTNLGALLMVMGLPYDSDGARNIAGSITALLTGQAYATSAQLAARLAPFPAYARNRHAMHDVLARHTDKLWAKNTVWDNIAKAAGRIWNTVFNCAPSGFRNAQVTLLAPTGTISFIMDAQTTGVEPDFALVKHKALAGGGNLRLVNQTVKRALIELGYDLPECGQIRFNLERDIAIEHTGIKPEHVKIFACANDIAPEGHLKMLAAIQPYLSGGISKTVNLPNGATVEDVETVFRDAWRLGLKCISIYRDGCKASQPLTTSKSKPEANAKQSQAPEFSTIQTPVRSDFVSIEASGAIALFANDVKFHKDVLTCKTCGHQMSVTIGVCHLCPICGATTGCS